MLNVTKELTALARKLGYTGKAPDTVAKAINAITASVGEGGGEGSGGCDCYTVTKEQLLSETVETAYEQPVTPGNWAMAELQYTDLIDMDTITVTFDGVDYTCTKHTVIEDDVVIYDYSLPDSPFSIVSILGDPSQERNIVYTPEEGQHTVAITVDEVAPSANFQAAANNCLPNMPLKCAKGTLYDVMREATLRGQLMYFHTTSGFFFIADCPGMESIIDNNELTIFPESNDVTASVSFSGDTGRLHITDANNPI